MSKQKKRTKWNTDWEGNPAMYPLLHKGCVFKHCPECGEVYTVLHSAFRKGLCHICNTELKEEEVK